jgi:sulfoxide reductase heme-binding subunit YedZ
MTAQASVLATATGPHLFWLLSRAAGSAALVLSSLSVCVGLSMGGRLLNKRGSEMRAIHEALALATLVALLVHGLALLGDAYLHPSLADISIPFASSYKTFWTAAGIVAFWALAALGLSYYFRARIGVARWRTLHRFTALAWLLGLVHSLGEGSDAGQAWFLAMTALVAIPALVLFVVRMRGASASPTRADARAPRAAQRAQRPVAAGSREAAHTRSAVSQPSAS